MLYVFYEFGVDVILIGVVLNGFNINDGVGVIVFDVLVCVVWVNYVDFGIVFDGDVDCL